MPSPTSGGLGGSLKTRVAFRVIGATDPARSVCALCGRGGAEVLIEHRSHRDTWHRDCVRAYFAAEVEPPVSDDGVEGLPR
jgi:hypothetical protein